MFFQNFNINLAIILAFLKFDWSDQLVLGNRGVAGLAWSMMSISGAFWTIRASLAAATPGWFRELAGIRSQATDSAVGMDLQSELKVCRKLRANMGEVLGISSEHLTTTTNPRCVSLSQLGHPSESLWKDIYAFDDSTASFIRSVSIKEEKGANIRVCADTTSNSSSSSSKTDNFQRTMLLLSILCKLAETLVLYLLDARLVCLTATLPWAFFLLVGLYVSNSDANNDVYDVIAGRPPTSISPGGPFRIVLNLKKPQKYSLTWRVFWMIGSILSLVSYVCTLYLLSSQPSQTVLCWLAFRLVDLYGCNRVYKEQEDVPAVSSGVNGTAGFYDSHETQTPNFTSYTLHNLPHHLRPKIFDLTLAASRYQSLIHARRTESYMDDSFSEDRIRSTVKLLDLVPFYPGTTSQNWGAAKLELEEEFEPAININININTNETSRHRRVVEIEKVNVEIVGVIGDTLLSNVAWITGLEYTPTDLYDCCIVSFRSPIPFSSNSKLKPAVAINIPCARVLSSVNLNYPNGVKKEDHTPQIVPKGVPNLGVGIEWIYFIPFDDSPDSEKPQPQSQTHSRSHSQSQSHSRDSSYLVIRKSAQFSCKGRHYAKVMTGEEITSMFVEGTLNISMTHVDQVKETVELAREVYLKLVKLAQ